MSKSFSLLIRCPRAVGALDNAAAKAVGSVVQYSVLSFGDRALLFRKLDMQAAVVFYTNEYFLVGLTIAEFCHTLEFFFRRLLRNPIKARHFARGGIKWFFIAVGNVEDIVFQILLDDEPPALFALDATEV